VPRLQTDSRQLTGLSGRQLKLSEDWKNPANRWHLGIKRAYELFPQPLVTRIQGPPRSPRTFR